MEPITIVACVIAALVTGAAVTGTVVAVVGTGDSNSVNDGSGDQNVRTGGFDVVDMSTLGKDEISTFGIFLIGAIIVVYLVKMGLFGNIARWLGERRQKKRCKKGVCLGAQAAAGEIEAARAQAEGYARGHQALDRKHTAVREQLAALQAKYEKAQEQLQAAESRVQDRGDFRQDIRHTIIEMARLADQDATETKPPKPTRAPTPPLPRTETPFGTPPFGTPFATPEIPRRIRFEAQLNRAAGLHAETMV